MPLPDINSQFISNSMKRLLALVLTLGLLVLAGPELLRQVTGGAAASAPSSAGASQAAPELATEQCTVARIVDGDTLRCAESSVNARLLLIDTPELAQGDFGVQASAALTELAPVGTKLRAEFDLDPRDQYGRDLVYLYLEDGRMVNEEMVRLGFAVVVTYPPNVRHVDRIRAAQEDAQRSGRGLWSSSAFDCTPADFRRDRC